MILSADALPTSGPPWLLVLSVVAAIVLAVITARAPVWLEKAKNRFSKDSKTAEEKAATGESILREWLKDTQLARDQAVTRVEDLEAEIAQLTRRVAKLETELYRLGWDGRTS